MSNKRPELAQTNVVEQLPLACANEQAAVEFLEAQRWGGGATCPECESRDVYQMQDRASGDRNSRFLWRCRHCGRQFTVRTGTVYEESLIPLHKWMHALWAAASAKNGVSAMEISRRVQVSHKSALFLLHRIRFAMSTAGPEPKFTGTIEAGQPYVGGNPRLKGKNRRGHGTERRIRPFRSPPTSLPPA